MSHELQFYIDGAWVDPVVPNVLDVIDPSNEDAFAQISLGSKADVDKAVAAAKRAFATYGFSTVAERLDLLNRIVAIYKKRSKDLALALSREMGAPRDFALEDQVGVGLAHLQQDRRSPEELRVPRRSRAARVIVREPIGVVGLITPWNWPQNQITLKVGPGTRRRLHHGAEAQRDRPARRHHLRRDPRRGRRAQGRVQPRQRRRPDGRPGARQPS